MDRNHTPLNDGFFMPGEFEPHRGCLMIWPSRPGSWAYGAVPARKAFCQVIQAIARSEQVWVAAGKDCLEDAEKTLGHIQGVTVFEAETDDAWARDTGPTFVRDRSGLVRGVNWEFNAWGGSVDGLYQSWEKDNRFAEYAGACLGYEMYDASPFVLEGGSIHSDGEGTILATEACLLSRGRNPQMNKEQIEEKLKEYLGAEKVIWLPRGIYQDETNEHVDNVCAFIRPGEAVLAWTDKKEDPQYQLSCQCLEALEAETDARGRKLTVHRLPIPDEPVLVERQDLEGLSFEEGEDTREEGERLAASYVNFYFSNGAVIMPAFGGRNETSDRRAAEILQKICPEREVIPVFARDILTGGGNIHCITQQIPKGRIE